MRLEWIEDILAVLDAGSFNAAAEERFLTPSAFTRRIRTIEESLGCALFDRSRKPVVLHRHALACVPELRDAMIALRRIRERLSDPGMNVQDRIILICQHALTGSVAPKLLENPVVASAPEIRIKSGSKNDCLLGLIQREVQFALVYETPLRNSSLVTEYCERLDLGKEDFVPLAKAGSFPESPGAALDSRIPTIRYPPDIFLGEVQKAALRGGTTTGIELVTVVETGLSLAMVEFVKRGIGIGWLPRSLVQRDIAAGHLVCLESWLPSFALDICLLRLKSRLPDKAENFWTGLMR